MFNHTAASQQMRSSCLPLYIDLLRLPRPFAPCILTTCTLSRTNELFQREGSETERGDSINVKLGRGLVCGAPRWLFACKLFEQCCWAAVTAAASRWGLKKCQHTAESTGGCLTPWMANGSIAPPHHLKSVTGRKKQAQGSPRPHLQKHFYFYVFIMHGILT